MSMRSATQCTRQLFFVTLFPANKSFSRKPLSPNFFLETSMHEALEAVRLAGVSVRQAAKEYSVNRTTLQRRVHGRHSKSVGGQQKFSVMEEEMLAKLLILCAQLGVPLSKILFKKVLRAAGEGKGWPEEKMVFSDQWHRAFLRRNSQVSQRVAHATSRKKAAEWTKEICAEWIKKLTNLADDGYLHDSSGLWNLDESAFFLAEVYKRVYVAKGTKEVRSHFDGDPKERLTVLACGNAAGNMLRPFILYDGKLQLSSRFVGTKDKCLIGVNKSGWMDCPNFTSYVRHELIPSMTTEKNCVFLDGHGSHVNNLDFLLECARSGKDIKVICFPAGQTSRLQPLDESVFGGMKYRWRTHLRELQTAKWCEGLPLLSRNTFREHLVRLFEKSKLSATLQSGFLQTGIFPFNSELILATIPVSSSSSSFTASADTVSPKRGITVALQEVNASDVDTAAFLAEFDRIASGATPAQFVSAAFYKCLIQPAPTERKKKDVRISTKAGGIMSDSSRIAYLEEKKAEKELKLLQKKLVNQRKKVISVKRRPKQKINSSEVGLGAGGGQLGAV